jgi:DNA-binding beta-propeller fold protein YncE
MKFGCRVTVLVAVLTGLLVPAAAGAAGLAGGSQLWVARYTEQGPDDPGHAAQALAVSPDGARVFVTGAQTVGYAAGSGKRMWASPVGSTGQGVGSKVAVSPDGTKVFVTGTVSDPDGAGQYITTAYSAATGARLWQSVYGPPAGTSSPTAIGVSPDGSTVFVTGASAAVTGDPTARRYGTVAYNAASGAERWAVRCCRGGVSQANSLAVSPGGTRIYVTGFSLTPSTPASYTTIAYSAATGAQVWIRRSAEGYDARSVGASPDGSRVYVSGDGAGGDVTVAYSAATGSQLWAARFANDAPGDETAAMAISKSGTMLAVTSDGETATGTAGYRTVAIRASDGQQLWSSGYPGGQAISVTISPTGTKVFVTGLVGTTFGSAFGTVAYCATTGAQLWASTYMGPVRNGYNLGAQVVASPDGARVFVTGPSTGYGGVVSYATLAYQA